MTKRRYAKLVAVVILDYELFGDLCVLPCIFLHFQNYYNEYELFL